MAYPVVAVLLVAAVAVTSNARALEGSMEEAISRKERDLKSAFLLDDEDEHDDGLSFSEELLTIEGRR